MATEQTKATLVNTTFQSAKPGGCRAADLQNFAQSAVVIDPAQNSDNTIQSTSVVVVPLILQGAVSQSADLQEWQDSTGTVQAKVDSTFSIHAPFFYGDGSNLTNVGGSGTLAGDVTGTTGANTVATVGGSTASVVHSAAVAVAAATNLNTASTLVSRDSSGNFSAGTITGTLSGNATNVSGVVAIANGGSGQSTAANAINALLPSQSAASGQFLTSNGSVCSWSAVPAYTADETTLHLSGSQFSILSNYAGQSSITTLGTITTGTWAGTTISTSHGGTGATSANAGLNALLPSQASASGQFLTSNGTNTSWASVPAYTADESTLHLSSGTFSVKSTYVGQSSITTLGTITTGVWNGTAVPVANGGTGSTTASAARTALGLGSAATSNTSAFLQPSNNLSDVSNAITALTNILPSNLYFQQGEGIWIQTGLSMNWATVNGSSVSNFVSNLYGPASGWIEACQSDSSTLGYFATGSLARNYVAKTANYSAVLADTFIGTSTNSFTVTLLAGSSCKAGQSVIVKDVGGNAGSSTITVQPASGTIDGASSKTITTNYGVVRAFTDGTNWFTY